PDWGWLRMPRTHVHIPDEFVGTLLHLLHVRFKATDLPDEQAIEARISASGGFSDRGTNRRVDHAAVEFVWQMFEKKGWKIEDRQHDFCGYDLLARKGNSELHLEVKGSPATAPGFILTANELHCAERDESFRLCLVTHALDEERAMKVFTVAQLRQEFMLSPIAYLGKPKSGVRAQK
ncbi:MAG TPA: DUF3883 domain-containing protein, partial [Tepidisphaeraceae bacterium]|nr:DUF3883 domain-containing protein [Tepidisphaeraceae bacterium]